MARFKVEFVCPYCKERADVIEMANLVRTMPLRMIETEGDNPIKAAAQGQFAIIYGEETYDLNSVQINDYYCSNCGRSLNTDHERTIVRMLGEWGHLKKVSE